MRRRLAGEIGPAILLPSGKLLAVGATGNTAIYDPARPAASAWTAGPTLKDSAGKTSFPIDAPGVLLPNGKVLLAGSPAPPCKYPAPTTFFEYDPSTNKAQVVANPPGANVSVFQTRFLLLPTGTVLYSNNSSTISMYFHDGAPAAAWKPTISHAPTDLVHGHTYVLSGTQFNGLSQACSYGDDAQMATNYPLVRITNTATKKGALPSHLAPLHHGSGDRQHHGDHERHRSLRPAGRPVLAGGRGQRNRLRPGYRERVTVTGAVELISDLQTLSAEIIEQAEGYGQHHETIAALTSATVTTPLSITRPAEARDSRRLQQRHPISA